MKAQKTAKAKRKEKRERDKGTYSRRSLQFSIYSLKAREIRRLRSRRSAFNILSAAGNREERRQGTKLTSVSSVNRSENARRGVPPPPGWLEPSRRQPFEIRAAEGSSVCTGASIHAVAGESILIRTFIYVERATVHAIPMECNINRTPEQYILGYLNAHTCTIATRDICLGASWFGLSSLFG